METTRWVKRPRASGAGGGVGVAALKNQNGVEMALTATGQGVKMPISQCGVGIKLKK